MTQYLWHQQYKKSCFCQVKGTELVTRATVSLEYGKPTISIVFPKGHDMEQAKLTAAELVRYLDGTLSTARLKYRGYPVQTE